MQSQKAACQSRTQESLPLGQVSKNNIFYTGNKDWRKNQLSGISFTRWRKMPLRSKQIEPLTKR